MCKDLFTDKFSVIFLFIHYRSLKSALTTVNER